MDNVNWGGPVPWAAALTFLVAGCAAPAWQPGSEVPSGCGRALCLYEGEEAEALSRTESAAVASALAAAGRSGVRDAESRFLSAGPRFALVWVTRDLAASLEHEHNAGSPLTAWGWQFEYQRLALDGDQTWLAEFVPIVTGLEQGLTLPAVNVLCGVRNEEGTEFMGGAYVSPNTVAVCFAIGHTFRAGEMSLPVNYTAAHNADGERHSITVGWNIRR